MTRKLTIKHFLLALFAFACLLAIFALDANGQTVTDCPHPAGCVVLSAERARKALADSDLVTAQAAEIMTLREAVIKQREVAVDVKIELAKAIGQLTGSQQEAVSQRAIIEFLLKNGRKKCGTFSLCIQ